MKLERKTQNAEGRTREPHCPTQAAMAWNSATPRDASPSLSATLRMYVLRSAFCVLRSAFCVFLLAGIAGCPAIGAVAYKFSGPPKVPPKYVPDQDALVVMVENDHNPGPMRMDAERIGRHVTEELNEYKIAPTVDPSTLEELREKRGFQAFRTMPISTVGKTVGAGQVLYIDLVSFDLEPAIGSDMLRGTADVKVRVVDAATGQTRWPLDFADGFPVHYSTSFIREGKDGAGGTIVREQLYNGLADRVGKLFRAWQSDTADGTAEDERT